MVFALGPPPKLWSELESNDAEANGKAKNPFTLNLPVLSTSTGSAQALTEDRSTIWHGDSNVEITSWQ